MSLVLIPKATMKRYIVVYLYLDNEENSYDDTEKTLKWTGDTFTLVAD